MINKISSKLSLLEEVLNVAKKERVGEIVSIEDGAQFKNDYILKFLSTLYCNKIVGVLIGIFFGFKRWYLIIVACFIFAAIPLFYANNVIRNNGGIR